MRAYANKRVLAPLAALVAVAAFAVAGASVAPAANVAIELCAVAGTSNPVGAVSVPIWGFGIPSTPGDCTTAAATLPGPVLSVNEGDDVTITVRNALPADPTPGADGTTDHVVSLEIPGVSFAAGDVDADVGGSATASFHAGAPGTYLYESSGDAGRQEAMGLYGALIVQPLTAGQAYDSASTAYDVQSTLVLSQVDPDFNAAPDTFDMNDYLATYWLIEGKAYPDTAAVTAAAGQRVLLRYLNAGYDNSSMSLLGMHQRVLARDAALLANPFLAATETIPAGGTEDAIAVVPSTAPPSANGFALFNRNLHVTNGHVAGTGGMLTFIGP
jgi:FtsP/CotA-like multicopper oxidase with cupredoxin domain